MFVPLMERVQTESLMIPQKMELVVLSLKALKPDRRILGGPLFHLHLPKGQSMRPVDMLSTGLGASSAWLRRVVPNNIDEWTTPKTWWTPSSWTIGILEKLRARNHILSPKIDAVE